MKIILTVFSEKVLTWGKWAIFSLEMACPHTSGPTLRISLKFCIMREPKRYGTCINGFPEKNFHLGKMDRFGLKIARHNSGSTQRIFFKYCRMKEAKRCMKISLIVFPEKKYQFG